MKYLPLLWSGIWRKRGRTLLIILQIGVAFTLFGVLQGMKTGIEGAVAATRADLLIVHSRVSLTDPLPLAQLEQIRSIPGVQAVSVENDLVGTYRTATQAIVAVAVVPDEEMLRTAPELRVKPEQFGALAGTRTGALVSVGLARKYGWKVGDRIPLVSNTLQANGSSTWTFEIVGTFSYRELLSLSDFVIINNAYLDEARLLGHGTVQHFRVMIADPRQAVSVADAIDRRFANSANETRTESLRELAQSQMQSIGDLNFVIRAVVGAVFGALLFSTATMMMQSIRERTPELAVLKTLGFTDSAVFLLIAAEAVTICIAAAALGLALAALAFPFAAAVVPGLSMPRVVVELGLACAALVALISVALPASSAARLQIVAALAGR
jgi:putative ABC transport system permease protein